MQGSASSLGVKALFTSLERGAFKSKMTELSLINDALGDSLLLVLVKVFPRVLLEVFLEIMSPLRHVQ